MKWSKFVKISLCCLFLVGITLPVNGFSKRDKIYNEYITLLEKYNNLAKAYNDLTHNVSIANIEGLNTEYQEKESLISKNANYSQICVVLKTLKNQFSELGYNYLLVSQINNPDESFIINKLSEIDCIDSIEAVTMMHDPNGLLSKEGGYTSCIYFTSTDIDQSLFDDESPVDKGTDAGGCIEVYANLEEAENRIEYLSQFDNTILYSGSYVIIGTVVIRTSFMLSDEQQFTLSNDIVLSLISVESIITD